MWRSLLPRLLGVLLVLSLTTGWHQASSAQAQGPDVTMTVTPYLNGHVKYNEWLPLRIRLDNRGADIETEVRSEIAGSSGQVTYGIRVPLPAGAHKEVVLYVQPSTYAQELTVQLVSGDELLAEVPVKDLTPHPHNVYIVGAVASDSTVLALINGVVLEDRGPVRFVPLMLTDIPERFEPLRSLDCLIISGVDTSEMTPAQGEALRLWINRGGRLLIGGGTAAGRTLAGLPDALRPGELSDVTELEALDALTEFAGEPIQVPGPFPAAFPVQMTGRPLISQDGQPLLVQRALGEGWVSYLALDPAASPFGAWTGTLRFWQRLLEPGSALPPNIPKDIPLSTFQSERMIEALTNLPALELPSITWLALLLGVYIVLIGPVNYLLLRRFRRLSWAWITIPLITAAFSVGGYLLGYELRGNDVIVNQISVIEVIPGEQKSLVQSYIGLFSPTRAGYDVEIGGDSLVGPMSRGYGGWGGTPAYAKLEVLQGDPVQVRGLEVNQWSMSNFQAETAVSSNGNGLEADLQVEGDQIHGTVHNSLDTPLEGIVLVSGRRFAHLGGLAPGEERRIDVPMKNDDQGYLIGSIFQEYYTENQGAVPREAAFFRSEADSRVVMLRQRVLEAYLQPFPEIPVGPGEMVLFGWTEGESIPVRVTGVRATIERTALVVTHLPMPVVDGRMVLPAGHLMTRVIDMEQEAGECGPGGRYYVARGQVTAEYRLPTTLATLSPTGLTLRLVSMDQTVNHVPDLYLYDWTSEQFVLLEIVQQLGTDYPIEHPERYLNAVSGTLRLHIEGDNQVGSCYQIDVELEGQIGMPD